MALRMLDVVREGRYRKGSSVPADPVCSQVSSSAPASENLAKYLDLS